MPLYFDAFPIVTYNGSDIRNILSKSALVKDLLLNYQHLVPYEIQSGDSITSVAFDYYGSVEYSWLVLLSAGLYDPFYAWPMSDEELDEALIKRYRSFGDTRPDELIIAAARDEIVFYENAELDGARIGAETYGLLDVVPGPEWKPVNVYDDAVRRNERNRNILLMKREYAPRMAYELRQTLTTPRRR
ncbi:MAG: hypothetical protein DDT26_00661 [Dehalococcoidia bacterium]|nr:hypothetical protein [Chloroflexota bacterium]